MSKAAFSFAAIFAALTAAAAYQYAHANPSAPEELVNKSAPDFTLQKVGGGAISLQQLRGKIVVLDFWYRACPWCIRAMPQVNQLAIDFKHQNVVVLGMNVDHNEADAQAVINQFGLHYPSLRASREVVQSFGVQGYPTAILIDQQGTIRAVHVGYTDSLHDDLSATIKSLLKS
ncbi:MAG TPA: TlpA disulfide reductase family protein [Phycisphaerae bacterium]|nr:TlpA disulfide reductase family protein [Phycisphaerae bacterium]